MSVQLHPPAALPPAVYGPKARRVPQTVWSRWRRVTPCLCGESNPSFIKLRKTKEVQGAYVSVCLTTSPENVCRLLSKKNNKKSHTKEGGWSSLAEVTTLPFHRPFFPSVPRVLLYHCSYSSTAKKGESRIKCSSFQTWWKSSEFIYWIFMSR